MKIDTSLLRSISVGKDEVEALELRSDEIIFCKGKSYHWDKPVVLMADRLNHRRGVWQTTMIRQVLECPDHEWGQDYAKPNRKARSWAESNGMPRVTVPGGIPPLTKEGTVAVPDFGVSGTSWFIVPEAVAVILDLEINYLDSAKARNEA